MADSLPPDSIEVVFVQLVQTSKSAFQTGTYTDILNSGNLHLIDNFDLRSEITSYHEALNDLELIEDYTYTYFSTYNMTYALNTFDFMSQEQPDIAILQDREFTNILVGYFSMIGQRMNAYKKIRRKCTYFKGVIKEYQNI